jgi:hypothetical protein
MTGMPRLNARLVALGSVHPSLALFHGRLCGRRPTGVGGVLVQPCFERVQTFEEGQHRTTHTQRGLLPIFSRDAESLWQGFLRRDLGGAASTANPVVRCAIASTNAECSLAFCPALYQ